MSPRRIRLKSAFFPLVESGMKRSTIRAGAKPGLVGPAVLVGGDRSVSILVTDVEVKSFDELTESDAQLDGFETLTELKNVLIGFYPDLGGDDAVSILHFNTAA